MSHRLVRAVAALAVPLSIALSAAPARAGSQGPVTSAPSARSAAQDVPKCTITNLVATSDLLVVKTMLTVDAVCTETVTGVTVKVDGVALIGLPIVFVRDTPVHATLVLPRILRLDTDVCVQIDGAEACAKVRL